MKKIFAMVLLSLFCMPSFAINEGIYDVGILLMQDSKARTYIVWVSPDSPAEKEGIPIGSELLSVDGREIKNLPLNDVMSLIGGQEGTEVGFVVKNNDGLKDYILKREFKNLSVKDMKNEYAQYLMQVVPPEYADAKLMPVFNNNRSIKIQVERNNYWAERKADFDIRYYYCKSCPEYEQNSCLKNLMAKELSKNASYQAKQFYNDGAKDILIKSIDKSNSNIDNIRQEIHNHYMQMPQNNPT